MSRFIELATETVANRNNIVAEKELKKFINQARKGVLQLFRSIYTYDDEILEHMKIRKTVKGYKGKYYLDNLVFDIDKSSNTDGFTHERAKEFVNKLEDDWKIDRESLVFTYSGTGYHILAPEFFGFEPSPFLPDEVQKTIKNYFPETDPKIYIPTGLIRLTNTINKKQMRYKVRLTYDELFNATTEDIMEIAVKGAARKFDPIEPSTVQYKDKIIKDVVQREKQTVRESPTQIATCIQKIYMRGPQKGKRHEEMMRMTAAFRRQGVPKPAIIHALKGWNSGVEDYEITRIVDNVFEQGYLWGCNDYILAQNCDANCIFFRNKNFTLEVNDAASLEKMLIQEIQSSGNKIDLNTIYPMIGKPFYVKRKNWITVIGDTKIGKTAFLAKIAVETPHLKWLIVQNELPEELYYRRNLQTAYAMSKDEVNRHFLTSTKTMSERVKHIQLYSKPIDPDGLRKLVAQHQPDCLILDTLNVLKVPKLGIYHSREEAVANETKDLAQQMGVMVFAVHHVPKGAIKDQDGRKKNLDIHSGRGDAAVEQLSDIVITFEGTQQDPVRRIRSAGARDESPFDFKCNFDWMTFQFIKIIED